MRTATVKWTHVWADNLREHFSAAVTYTRATYRDSDSTAYTDSEALGQLLSEIDPGENYSVKFAPATKKAAAAARVPLTFDLEASGPASAPYPQSDHSRAVDAVTRAEKKARHDWEPSDIGHPMSTDPLCRICGYSKRYYLHD